MHMELDYIVVQAGGKGTRMEYLTANKPKALIPIQNLPMLFHLFHKYPDKRFIIIGDYKYDVLKQYLRAFADVTYYLINAEGHQGTCAGIKQAMRLLPEEKSFMLIWSDLILPNEFELPQEKGNYLGLSTDFPCRWKYEKGEFEEERSTLYGVAGLFIFEDKKLLDEVPSDGELVRWMKTMKMKPIPLSLHRTKEYGLLSEYNKLTISGCRPFNRITVEGDKIVKEGIDELGKRLAVREKNWYHAVQDLGFKETPLIYSYEPFVMEKVKGKNIFEYQLDFDEKNRILIKIVDMLKNLHSLGNIPTDYFSMQNAYLIKTFERLSKIRNLVPFAEKPYIVINEKRCRNIFFYQNELEQKLNQLDCKRFVLLHGDCTFSNMMLRGGEDPLLIDPRGYFGYTELYGDAAYDWAKLYYSIVGNYDRFNRKDFTLTIGEEKVTLTIESNGWEDMENIYLSLIEDEVGKEQIQLIHSVIWLSLTTYAWEDYDSICGAFYNGLYYLEDVL